MNIICEGADSSGKSTLAKYLSQHLHLPIKESEGPPTSQSDLDDRLARYKQLTDIIIVRHPVISQPVYAHIRSLHGQPTYTIPPSVAAEFYASQPLIIYCQPRPLDGHVTKGYDNKEHVRQITDHHYDICRLYNTWADTHADLFYRVGRSKERLLAAVTAYMFDPARDICNFHTKFGLTYTGPPRPLVAELSAFRVDFMREEIDEYDASQTLHGQLDALVDLVYVALGTSYLHGFPFREAWRRVHAANMTKVRALRASDSVRGSVYDVVKPDGFKPPDLTDLVSAQRVIKNVRDRA